MNRRIGLILRLDQFCRQMSSSAKNKASYYELLGVSQTATAGEIKAAYYEKTKLYHPDVVPPTEENLKIFRQISEAYGILGSDVSRKDYDENVLGLTREDASTEDPIAAYKRRTMGNHGNYSWTRDYCEHLRKQQSNINIASTNSRQKLESDQTFSSFIPIVALFLIMMFLVKNNSSFPSPIQRNK